uniref:Ac1147-like protein n=1 Tax=Coptotermes formosanus TaxID=36987 RepID=R4V0S2_COPFO|nr:Ac1147-like protein [Coptotermes formosanus]
MPLDVLGRTRATLKESACPPWPKGPGNPLNLLRARDWGLQLFPMDEEFPVSASHKLALITSLPFVHTARRYYRLNDLVRSSDRWARGFAPSIPLGRCPNLII